MDRRSGRSFVSWSPIPLALVAGLPLMCCRDSAPQEDPGYTRRDSAGITIVENTRPAWRDGEGWNLSPEPLLTFGVTDGPEEYAFFRARKAMRMGDGRILVLNSGTYELRFYDPSGTFLSSSGREGQGPGEFTSLVFAWRVNADSLVVYDSLLRRLSVFDENGAYARSFRFSGEVGTLAFPAGVFGDGTLLTLVDERDVGDYSELGVVRGEMRFGRFDSDGALMDVFVSLPGTEVYKGTFPSGRGFFTLSSRYPVTGNTIAGPSSWFYGSSDSWEFQERGLEGELLRVIRLLNRGRRPMPEAARVAREERLGRMKPLDAEIQGQVPLPDSLPTHNNLLLDPEGNLWAEGWVVVGEQPYWYVIDSTGRWLGEVSFPLGLRVSEIGTDYVVGIWVDPLGVQQVRAYGLQKDGGPNEGGPARG